MLEYVLVAILLAVAYKTKPDEESFKVHFSSTAADVEEGGGGWFVKHILRPLQGARMNYEYKDMIFLSFARMADSPDSMYIGAFGFWFEVPKMSSQFLAVATSSTDPEAQAEGLRQQAFAFKRDRQCVLM